MQADNRRHDKILTTRRIRVARYVAIAVDAIQWILLPLTMGGAASPVNDALDVGTAAFMIAILGWRWAFLPTFLAEIIPFVDLVPTWTLAVWLATRNQDKAPDELPAAR
jgi:hypothetical protein